MKSSSGFTLIETLAALAIASVIILSAGELMHQSIFFFDHGTRAVDQGEQLALAVDCLRRDFAAARFIVQRKAKIIAAKDKNVSKKEDEDVRAAFIGTAASELAPAKIIFITAGGRAAGPRGEEVVSISSQTDGGYTELVRRQIVWMGPRMRLEEVEPGGPVILLKGKFSISFSFSELTKRGRIVWHSQWSGDRGVPYSVRVNLNDSTDGSDLFPGMEFHIYADAPPVCVTSGESCFRMEGDIGVDPNEKSDNQQMGQAR
jgi:prepilin-type N-terminal cleavage/methylation domain-containing protein